MGLDIVPDGPHMSDRRLFVSDNGFGFTDWVSVSAQPAHRVSLRPRSVLAHWITDVTVAKHGSLFDGEPRQWVRLLYGCRL